MTGDPLRVRVVPAHKIAPADFDPVVLRSSALVQSCPEPENARIVCVDGLLYAGAGINPDWRTEFLDSLRTHAHDGSVTYAVAANSYASDSIVQYLLVLEDSGAVSVKLEAAELNQQQARALSRFRVPHVHVDALALLEAEAASPFAGGSFPLSSSQTTVLTGLDSPALPGVRRALERVYGPDLALSQITNDGDSEITEIPLSELGRDAAPLSGYLIIPAATGDHFYRTSDDLQRLVARLRAPGGCPWDREQTNQSLTRNLIEESYELLDAIESGNIDDMREEMGDFLLQAYLHCQITEEAGGFTLEDVFDTLITKLVRRHPHVFAATEADTADHVVRNWDEIKRAERAEKPESANGGPLGNIPVALPALVRAQALLKRARRTDMSVEDVDRRRDAALIRAAGSDEDAAIIRDLISNVDRALELRIDVEEIVRRWTREFEESFIRAGESDEAEHS